MADLRKITLFKFMYWKISKLKFGARFRKAVKQIQISLKSKLTQGEFDKLIHYDRYVKKGKKVLFSKSFDMLDMDNLFLRRQNGEPSPAQNAKANPAIIKRLNFLQFLKKKAADRKTDPSNLGFYLLQKVKEYSPSWSASNYPNTSMNKIKIEATLKNEIDQLEQELSMDPEGQDILKDSPISSKALSVPGQLQEPENKLLHPLYEKSKALKLEEVTPPQSPEADNLDLQPSNINKLC